MEPRGVVLVAEPAAEPRARSRASLEALGYAVVEAAGGNEAMSRLLERRPDVVLASWHLGDMDAGTLLARCRGDERLHGLSVLVAVDATDDGQICAALDAGALDVLRAPFDASELRARVHAAHQLGRMREQLAQLSDHDPVTGLVNRPAFEAKLLRDFKLAKRYERDLSLALLRVGGAEAGLEAVGCELADLVLSQFARQLVANAREVDIVARFASDVFALLMPETGLEAALVPVQRLQDRIAKLEFGHPSQPLQIQMRAGASSLLFGSHHKPHDLISGAQATLARAGDGEIALYRPE